MFACGGVCVCVCVCVSQRGREGMCLYNAYTCTRVCVYVVLYTCRSGLNSAPGMVHEQHELQNIRPQIRQWCFRTRMLNLTPHSEHSLHALSGIQYFLRSLLDSCGDRLIHWYINSIHKLTYSVCF